MSMHTVYYSDGCDGKLNVLLNHFYG